MSNERQGPNKLVESIVRGFITAKMSTMAHDHKARTVATSNYLEELEAEFAPMIQPLLQDVHDLLPESHPLKSLLAEAMNPQHQLGFILQLIFTVMAIPSVIIGVSKVGAQTFINDAWVDEPTIPLPPADLADMVERNIIDLTKGLDEAAKSGVPTDDFALLVQNTGEPYGVIDGLRLLRRGAITLERFTDVLYYSRIRNEFLPDVLQLQYDNMSPADAIELTLKQVLSNAEGQAAFVRGGGMSSEFPDLLAGAGNPPGVASILSLWNHGLVTEDQVNTVIAHSRINPEFTDITKLQRHKFLSDFQIHQALVGGSIDAATATDWLIQDGLDAEQAAAFAQGSAASNASSTKHVTLAMITDIYEEGGYSDQQFSDALVNLGYSINDVPTIVSYIAAKRALTMQKQAVTRIKGAFLARHIGAAKARADMGAMQLPTDQIEQYIALWTVELDSVVKELSVTDIGNIFKAGGYSEEQALTKFEQMGFSNEDATALAFYYGGTPPAGSPAATQAAATPVIPAA